MRAAASTQASAQSRPSTAPSPGARTAESPDRVPDRGRLDAMEEQLAKLTQAVMLVNQSLQTSGARTAESPGARTAESLGVRTAESPGARTAESPG